MAADPGPLSIPNMARVPTSAPMTNAAYEQQVDKKLEAIRVAAEKLMLSVIADRPPQMGGEFGLPGYIDTPWGAYGGKDPKLKPFKVPIDEWRPVFLEFLWPNLEASLGLDAEFTAPAAGPLDRLLQLSSHGEPQKGNSIRAQLNEWYSPDTESAARLFRDKYCRDINEMVSAQIQMMQAFQLILRSQTVLIELGRYQALRIADATISKLGQVAESETAQSKKLIKDFAGAIGGVSVVGPGILGSVISSLSGFVVDSVMDAVLEGKGEKPWDITNWMHGMLADLRRQIRVRSSMVQEAIKKMDWYLTGKGIGPGKDSREKLLPADIAI
jgi:hypothetical protein